MGRIRHEDYQCNKGRPMCFWDTLPEKYLAHLGQDKIINNINH